MEYMMEDFMDEMLGEVLDGIMSGVNEYVMSYLMEFIQAAAGVILLISLPTLILGIVYCFFGLRAYRVLLLIDSIINGGTVGAILLAVVVLVNGGSASGVLMGLGFGFVIFAIIFGVLAWFCPKVMLVIHSLFVGIIQVTGMFMVMGLGFIAPIVIGVICGLTFAVLVVIFQKWTIMGTHAYKGGLMIAQFLAIAMVAMTGDLTTVSVTYWICAVGFIAGGFYVQYLCDKKNPVMLDGRKQAYVQQQSAYEVYQQPVNNVPYQQPVYETYQQPVNNVPYQQSVPVGGCKLIGLEGMYKGFEFDIDKEIVLGRDVEKCNIIFPEGTKGVSRVQCQLTVNEQTGAVSIIDNFSSYGTSVNGIKLTQGVEMYLNTGDVIMFGENNVFKVQY